MKLFKIFCFLFFFCIINLANAVESNIQNIRLNTDKNIERIVFDLDKKTNFNAFVLKNPNRLVVDFKNTTQNVKAPDVKTDKIIDSIRVGKFSPTDTRLVFDLNIGAKIIKSFYLSPNDKNKFHRIVIDLEFSKQDLEKEDLIGKLIDDNNSLKTIINEIIK